MKPALAKSLVVFICMLATTVAAASDSSFISVSLDKKVRFSSRHHQLGIPDDEVWAIDRGRSGQKTFAQMSKAALPDIWFPLASDHASHETQRHFDLSTRGRIGKALIGGRDATLQVDGNDYGHHSVSFLPTGGDELRETATLPLHLSPVPEPATVVSLLAGIGILAREVVRRRHGPAP